MDFSADVDRAFRKAVVRLAFHNAMKIPRKSRFQGPICLAFGLSCLLVQHLGAADLVPLDLKLPAPAFRGTPTEIQTNSYTEPYSDKLRPAFMVPPGLKNVASGAKLLSSDTNATPESLAKIMD